MAINTTFTAGQVLTAQQMNNLPMGLAAYASTTSLSQNVSTLADITGMSVTFTAVANRLYLVTGRVFLATTEGTNPGSLYIRNGSTTLQTSTIDLQVATVAYSVDINLISTFTAGSVTLKLSAARAAGSGTVTASAGTGNPAQIMVIDLGIS